MTDAHDDQLQKIYDLNQANTPEVGSLESKKHLTKLLELSAYNLLILKGDEVDWIYYLHERGLRLWLRKL